MRLLSLLFVLVLAPNIYAFKAVNYFTCKGSVAPQGNFKTEVTVEGLISTIAPNKYEGLFNTDVKVECNSEGNECWSEINDSYSVKNDPNYRPRRYLNHAKFEHYLEGGSGVYDHWAASYIVIPHSVLKENQTFDTEFRGHIILSGIDDHHGASVTLNCQVKYFNAEYVLDLKIKAGEATRLKVSTRGESECGEYDPYFFGDVCGYRALVLSGDEVLLGEEIYIYMSDSHPIFRRNTFLEIDLYDANPYHDNDPGVMYYAVPYLH